MNSEELIKKIKILNKEIMVRNIWVVVAVLQMILVFTGLGLIYLGII